MGDRNNLEQLRRQRPGKRGPAKEDHGQHSPVKLAWQAEIGKLMNLTRNRLFTDSKMEVEEIHRRILKMKIPEGKMKGVLAKAEKVLRERKNFSVDQAIHFIVYGVPF